MEAASRMKLPSSRIQLLPLREVSFLFYLLSRTPFGIWSSSNYYAVPCFVKISGSVVLFYWPTTLNCCLEKVRHPPSVGATGSFADTMKNVKERSDDFHLRIKKTLLEEVQAILVYCY